MSDSGDEPIAVLHNVQCWLNQTETWLFNQVRHLPPSIESYVLCQTTANLKQFPWPRIHPAGNGSTNLAVLQQLKAMFRPLVNSEFIESHAKRTNARVLHSHYGYMGWSAMDAAASGGLKHVVTFYGLDVNFLPRRFPWWRMRYRHLFREADAVLCEGPFMAASIRDLGCRSDKIRVHHLGVDLSSFEYRERHWNPREPLRILVAGTFREKKGIPYALAALGKIACDLPVEVTVIGDATSERRSRSERRSILKTIASAGLGQRVRLLGFQPHSVLLREAYAHHVFLSPSVTAHDGDSEGGAPVGIIEMAASGMPVVSTTHCDIPEVLPPGCGLLAPERDVDGLVAHLRWLVENPTAWTSLTQRARSWIEQEFDARTQGQKLAEIYRALLTERKDELT